MLNRMDFDEIRVDQDSLADVLHSLGPPDELVVTPTREILEYRHGIFRGTDLSISSVFDSVPGLSIAIGVFQGVFNTASGRNGELDQFRPQDPVQRLLPLVLGGLTGFIPQSRSTQDLLDLKNRQIRYSLLRILLDRERSVVREKSFRDALTGETSVVRSTFLRD